MLPGWEECKGRCSIGVMSYMRGENVNSDQPGSVSRVGVGGA